MKVKRLENLRFFSIRAETIYEETKLRLFHNVIHPTTYSRTMYGNIIIKLKTKQREMLEKKDIHFQRSKNKTNS